MLNIIKYFFFLFAVSVCLIYDSLAQTVTDIDGNVYNTINIGTQVWLKENLNVTHYTNGTDIPNVTNVTSWRNLTTAAYCDFDNTIANSLIYGKLYNYYVLDDTNKVCPVGWHVSSDADWNVMEKYLESSIDTTATAWVGTKIGGILKEAGVVHWNNPNTGAIDSIGFSALPGGYRNLYGSFYYLRNYGYWWSPKLYDTLHVWKRNLNYDNSQISRSSNDTNYRRNGFSVRCVKNELITGAASKTIENIINIYPNPVSNDLTVVCNKVGALKMQIFNVLGECLITKNIGNDIINCDISFLHIGVYIVKITGFDWASYNKIVKK